MVTRALAHLLRLVDQFEVGAEANGNPNVKWAGARATQKASEADGWCEVTSLTSELRQPVPRPYAVAFN